MDEKTKETEEASEPTRGWMLLVMGGLFPWFLLIASYGAWRVAYGFWICSSILALTVKLHSRLNECRWFWIVMALAVPIQVPFVWFVPWEHEHRPAVAGLPVAVLDLVILEVMIKLGEKLANRSDEDSHTGLHLNE